MSVSTVSDANSILSQTISSSDHAGQLLTGLFGENWDTLSQTLSSGTLDASASLVCVILAALGTVALTIGIIIETYTIFIGVIGTAHEGSPLGKSLSTIWTPIRGASGIALLIPTSKGLSVLMVVILLCVGYSVKLSNYIYAQGLDYLQEHNGKVVCSAPAGMRENTKEVAKGILASLVAQHHLAMKAGRSFSSIKKVVTPTEDSTQYVIQFQPPTQNEGLSAEDMGQVFIPCSNASGDTLCKAREAALEAMIDSLAPVAKAIVANGMTDTEMSENGVSASRDISDEVIPKAINVYLTKIAPLTESIVAESDSENTESLNTFLSSAKDVGFVGAGSYYWTFSRFVDAVHTISGNMPKATGPDVEKLRFAAYNDPKFDNLVRSTSEITENLVQKQKNAARQGDSQKGTITKVLALMQNAFTFGLFEKGQDYMVSGFAETLMEGDPIATMADLGNNLMLGAVTAYTGYIVLRSTLVGLETTGKGVWEDVFSGGTIGGVASGIAETARSMMPMVLIALISLFSLGLMLAFYLPALPWILWISAIIGWIILLVETLCAAPLWAVGHMLPGGEGFAGNHGRQGYILLLNVLARPPLMVMGFFFAIIIMTIIGKILGWSFLIFFSSSSSGNYVTVFSLAAYLFILGSVVVILAHKVFGLTTHLSENVIRWLGGGQASLGEHQDEQRARAIFMAGGGVVQQAGHAGLRPGGNQNKGPASPNGGGGNGEGGDDSSGGGGSGVSSDTKKLGTVSDDDNSEDF